MRVWPAARARRRANPTGAPAKRGRRTHACVVAIVGDVGAARTGFGTGIGIGVVNLLQLARVYVLRATARR